MLSPSDYNDAVPQFTNGNYANTPLNPLYIEEPDAVNYNRGSEPIQTLPAQWWNWLMNQITAKLNKLNIYVKNIFDELAQLLSLVSVTPDGTEEDITTGQLKDMFQTKYPVFVENNFTTDKGSAGSKEFFNAGGVYDYTFGSTTPASWLGKAFALMLGRNWTTAIELCGSFAYGKDYNVYISTQLDAVNHNMRKSTDGKTWEEFEIPDWGQKKYRNVEYGGGEFLVCFKSGFSQTSDQDTVLISYDGGENWERLSTATYGVLFYIYVNNRWYLATRQSGSGAGALYYKEAGTNEITPVTGISYICNCIEYGNGMWVVGTRSHGCYYSTDGISWYPGTGTGITGYTITSIKYGNNRWVAGTSSNGCFWSDDGMAWTAGTGLTSESVLFPGIFHESGLCCHGRTWVARTTAGIWYSTDGKAWTKCVTDTAANNGGGVVYDNGIWLASGAIVKRSFDGQIWEITNQGGASACCFTCVDGLWLLAGGALRYSDYTNAFE